MKKQQDFGSKPKKYHTFLPFQTQLLDMQFFWGMEVQVLEPERSLTERCLTSPVPHKTVCSTSHNRAQHRSQSIQFNTHFCEMQPLPHSAPGRWAVQVHVALVWRGGTCVASHSPATFQHKRIHSGTSIHWSAWNNSKICALIGAQEEVSNWSLCWHSMSPHMAFLGQKAQKRCPFPSNFDTNKPTRMTQVHISRPHGMPTALDLSILQVLIYLCPGSMGLSSQLLQKP